MKQSEVANIILVRAVEEVRPEAISPEALVDAFAAAGDPDDDGAWLSRRAAYLIERCLAPYRRLVRMTHALDGGTPWVVVPALLVGLVSNYLGPVSRIHVIFNPIALLVVWNLLVYAGLMVQSARRGGSTRRAAPSGATTGGAAPGSRPAPTGAAASAEEPAGRAERPEGERAVRPSPVVRWTIRQVVPAFWLRARNTGATAQQSAAAISRIGRRFWSHWGDVARPVLTLNMRRLFHWAAFSLTLGALAGMYGRGLVFEYNVIWRSTFIRSPEVITWILRALVGPGCFFLDMPLPDQQDAELLMTVDGAPAASWIHLYAVSAILFVLIPRGLLALGASIRRRALSSQLQLPLDDSYYARLLDLARTRQVQLLEEAISADVRMASGEFADDVAMFVAESLYDQRIVPRLEQFRRRGGSLRALEQAIQRECTAFREELSRHVPVAQHAFERSLAERIEHTMAVQLSVLPVPGAGLTTKVDSISERSGRAVAGALGHRLADLIAGPVTAAVAVTAGALGGGFGETLGTAVVVGLLGTTGPVGFLIGALAGLAATGAGWWLGRGTLARSIQDVSLPRIVTQVTLLRLNAIVAKGRERCHASVRDLMSTELEKLTPKIAEQIWVSVKPVLGEQQRKGLPLGGISGEPTPPDA
jgi:hypothetical protein